MRKTPCALSRESFPPEVRPFLSSCVQDFSCSPDARVYYSPERDVFIKVAPSLGEEARMAGILHRLGLSPKTLLFCTLEGQDYLVTERAHGDDGTSPRSLADPKRLARRMGEALRRLHGTPPPPEMPNRLSDALRRAEENHEKGIFDPSYSAAFSTAEEAWGQLEKGRELLCEDTLIHGDFCLPNLILSFRGVALIDTAAAGRGDRHTDLFWGCWSLRYNLGPQAPVKEFLDAYGKDRWRQDALLTAEALECFL